ncbi:MAG: metallophosphoesterase [Lachnospiraceae bacterium]|nr:metallophosphoesterase [Lachnospiraceae bacterium]
MRFISFLFGLFASFFAGVSVSDIHNIKLRHYVCGSEKIRKDLRVAVLSDLHGRSFGKDNRGLIAAIDRSRPDMILMCGDIMTAKDIGHSIKGSVDVAEKLITRLSDKYPVYFVLGNHESRVGWMPWLYDFGYEDMIERFRNAGARILDNESIRIEEFGVRIYGLALSREYYTGVGKHAVDREVVRSYLGEADREYFSILLAHDPVHLQSYAAWGADMCFSGHYHGGIMRLPVLGGVISPKPELFPKYSGGSYSLGGRRQIVSCGLGSHSIPLRIFNPAELVIVDLLEDRDGNIRKA